MGKIIIDERRAVRIGEVCAIKLKDIHASCISVDSDITKKFVLQPIEEIKNKILTAKTVGQQYLQQQHRR